MTPGPSRPTDRLARCAEHGLAYVLALASLRHIAREGKGVAVLLNCGEDAAQLLAQFEGTARASHAPERGRMDLRTYGIGAQILRECGVHRMTLMGNPRRLPSMAGYGLEITGHLAPQ